MPDITFPNVFVDTNATAAADVEANIYEPRSTPRTLEVINGRLSRPNLLLASVGAHTDLSREEVRRGSFVAAEPTRGATANRDYFRDFWRGDWSLGESEADDRALAIVGASKRLYTPWTAQAIWISWNLSVVFNPPSGRVARYYDGSGSGFMGLYVNGIRISGMTRRFSDGRFMMVERTAAGNPFNATAGYPDARFWSGAFTIDAGTVLDQPPARVFTINNTPLLKGWHDISIRIAHQNKHARVRTSNITAFAIR